MGQCELVMSEVIAPLKYDLMAV